MFASIPAFVRSELWWFDTVEERTHTATTSAGEHITVQYQVGYSFGLSFWPWVRFTHYSASLPGSQTHIEVSREQVCEVYRVLLAQHTEACELTRDVKAAHDTADWRWSLGSSAARLGAEHHYQFMLAYATDNARRRSATILRLFKAYLADLIRMEQHGFPHLWPPSKDSVFEDTITMKGGDRFFPQGAWTIYRFIKGLNSGYWQRRVERIPPLV